MLRRKAALPPAGQGYRLQDVYEASFLAAGPGRVADAAIVALYADGRILIAEPGIASIKRRSANSPVERAVLDELATAPTGSLAALRREVMRADAVQSIGDRLAERGLLRAPGQKSSATTWWGAVLGVLCAIAFIPGSIIITGLGHSLDWDRPPVPFVLLVAPALISGAVLGFSGIAKRRVTLAGQRAMSRYRQRHSRTKSMAGRVALRGARGVEDPTVQTLLITAAAASTLTMTSSGSTGGSSSGATVWCASSGDSGCGGASGGGSDGGGGGGCGGSSSSCGGGGGGCGGGGGGG
ncbi:TIGR04222 domain-containing membrane protein [Streptomyces sp. NPDC055078]